MGEFNVLRWRNRHIHQLEKSVKREELVLCELGSVYFFSIKANWIIMIIRTGFSFEIFSFVYKTHERIWCFYVLSIQIEVSYRFKFVLIYRVNIFPCCDNYVLFHIVCQKSNKVNLKLIKKQEQCAERFILKK